MPRRKLVILIVALTALVLVSVSSALAAPGAQTRVWAQNGPGQVNTGVSTLDSSCTHQGSIGSGAEFVSGFCVATEDTGALSDGWAGTNMSDEESFNYHYAKHGDGQTPEQYAHDAQNWAANPAGTGKPVQLANGETGLRYRTPGGGPGGILDPNGKIVTFGYH